MLERIAALSDLLNGHDFVDDASLREDLERLGLIEEDEFAANYRKPAYRITEAGRQERLRLIGETVAQEIQEALAKYDLSLADVTGPRKGPKIVEARKEAFQIAVSRFGRLIDAASYLGKSPSAVHHILHRRDRETERGRANENH